MATKIRLRRTGTRNLATFRIVAADSRSPRDGRFLEILGHYDPRREGTEKVAVNAERVQYWIGTGAQVSEAVKSLLVLAGITLPASKQRRKRKKASLPQEPAAATAAPAEASAAQTGSAPGEATSSGL